MSFIYGATGSTTLDAIPAAMANGEPLLMLGMGLLLAGLGFKIAAVPFHMWVPDTYEAASTPFVAWLSVAPKAAGFIVVFRLYVEGVGPSSLVWVPVVSVLAGMTIVTGNLMAIPQQNVKRLLAYSGIAHIGYMLMGMAAMSARASGWCCSTWWPICSGTWARSWWSKAVAQSEHSDSIDAYRGLAQRSPLLALAC